MPAPPVRAELPAGRISEGDAYRKTHFRAYDEDGFASAFKSTAPEGATLESVLAYLSEKFRGTGGTGYESKDLVVFFGSRIVAVVTKGEDGLPRDDLRGMTLNPASPPGPSEVQAG